MVVSIGEQHCEVVSQEDPPGLRPELLRTLHQVSASRAVAASASGEQYTAEGASNLNENAAGKDSTWQRAVPLIPTLRILESVGTVQINLIP